MDQQEILDKYNLDKEKTQQYIDQKLSGNKKDTETNTDLSYSTIQRYEKKFQKMSRKERNTLTAHLSINNATQEEK